MTDSDSLSPQAADLVAFYDGQGCLSISELIKWLDTDAVGKKIRKVGTSAFGIRHKFKPGMLTEERMLLYATYSNPFYLGSMSGEKLPLDTLQDLKEAFPETPSRGKQEFDHFCLELLQSLTGRKDPEVGVAFSVIMNP